MATGALSSLGLGSGLDLQNILDQLKEVEKAPITAKEDEKTELKKEINAFNGVKAKLFSMKSHSLSLSLESDFLNNKAAVSDEEIITARVDNGVPASSTTIDVTQKARANSWQSVGVASKEAVIYPEPETTLTDTATAIGDNSGTMTIKYGAAGSQSDIDVAINPEMSLQDVADAVNTSENNSDDDGDPIVQADINKNSSGNYYIRIRSAQQSNSADSQVSVEGFDYVKSDTAIAFGKEGSSQPTFVSLAPGTTYAETADAINNSSDSPLVRAQVIDDGSEETPYKLILTSKKTGEDNRIAVQNLPGMTEVTGADGDSLNARFTVNGIDYQRQSNDGLDDVIPGAVLNLKKTGEATVNVQHDMDSVKEHIKGLVEGFNTLISDIKGDPQETGEDKENDAGQADLSILEESYTVKKMVASLHSLMGTRVDSESQYSSLYDLGMEVSKDGSVSLDENTLDQAIAADPEGIKELFIGDVETGITGLGDTINDGITDMISTRGTITTEISSDERQLDRLDKDIETATERLNKRYDTMTSQFASLDVYINRLNNEADYLSSMIDSFNKAGE